MVLVDTSVLINYFKGKSNEKTEKFETIIQNKIPFGINNFIYQELLQGAASEKEFNLLKEYLSSQRFYELKYGRKSFENAAKIYFRCRKRGITVRSTIDLLIVETALENDLYLLHNDKDFSYIASVISELKEY
ncbi:PIN domain nuclease [Deferribacter autotrophicus]|uniref:PIN domain nuclease n=1 Tax=Deferribacter autotrophicus TaxID=500465 RepID=A0A5A8F4S7_9BACT|nr:PIN domain nuclease [Deferribacter autotrophicus]KAA0257652.1 PIN domain nuclease [Deferribacter autotrophicus]